MSEDEQAGRWETTPREWKDRILELEAKLRVTDEWKNYAAPKLLALQAIVDVVREEIVASGSGHVDCGDSACVLCRLRKMIAAVST